MKKTYLKRLVCLAAAIAMMLTMAACESDYPVVNRKLDITELLEACFEGSGYSLDLDGDETISVDGVADRLTVNMDESADAISDVRDAVRRATAESDGLTGIWTAQVDISPIICENFADINGLELESYMSGIYLTGELTFTSTGAYMLHFNSSEEDEAKSNILSAAVKATKTYLSSRSSGVAKIVINAIDDSTLSEVMDYVVRMAISMLKNGASGSYSAKTTTISFTDCGSCTYKLNGDTLTLTNADCSGVLQVLNGHTTTFERA